MTRSITVNYLSALLAAGLGGCATFDTYNHARPVPRDGRASSTYIDIKQRAVFTVPEGARITVCAEPSPDAIASLAATANGSVAVQNKGSASAAFGIAESASAFGLRTQSIQLMRDTMYRMCEGLASGKLSSLQFENLHRRLQSSMVAILAIEQLTGTVRAPTVLLSSTAKQASADLVATRTDKVVAARQAATRATDTASASATAADAASAALDQYMTTAGAAKDSATYTDLNGKKTSTAAAAAIDKAAAAAAKSDLASQEDALAAAKAGGDVSADAKVAETGGTGPAAGDVAAVATAVQTIVSDTLSLSFMRELCATVLTNEVDAVRETQISFNEGVDKICLDYSRQTIDELSASNLMKKKLIELTGKSKYPESLAELLLLSGSTVPLPASYGAAGEVVTGRQQPAANQRNKTDPTTGTPGPIASGESSPPNAWAAIIANPGGRKAAPVAPPPKAANASRDRTSN